MRNDKIITGLVLVMLGASFLLSHFGVVHIHWVNFFHLWPVFLVIAGINLIFATNHSNWATALKAFVIVGGFAVVLFADTGRRPFWSNNQFHFKYDDDNFNITTDDEDDDEIDTVEGSKIVKVQGNAKITEPFNPAVKVAELNISGGGAAYYISDTTNLLLAAETKEFGGRYEFTNTTTDSLAVLNFKLRNKNGRDNHIEWDADKNNSANFKLNPNPEWVINVKAGAAKIDFDLSGYKVRSLNLNGGAAAFDVKLGMPVRDSKVEVATGVSEINIKVPQGAACQIITESGLSSVNADGFKKLDGNKYETPDFATAKNKYYIKMKGGLSGFNVSRY